MPLTQDVAAVRAVLQRDPGWSVYALADLAPPYSEHSEWRLDGDGVVLLYRAFSPPVLFASGNVAPLLNEVAGEGEMYVSAKPEIPHRLRALGYRVGHELNMLRMVLAGRLAQPPPDSSVRLGPADEGEIRELFAAGGYSPPFFHGSMLRHGVYFGAREEGRLVAVAGTHVLAPEEGVAGLGNVYTRPDWRGRGLGRLASGAVTAELLRLGVHTIALNVEAGNAPAIRVYERLGFRRHCEYREAVATRMIQS